MAEPFIGMIIIVPYNFAPRGWAFCDGQLMSIAQNTALFSLLGTSFGGNGQTTFGLPDLRGRFPMHAGASTGPGLSPHTLGERAGVENTTLLVNNLPAHSHSVTTGAATLPVSSSTGNIATPSGNVLARANDGESNFIAAASANGTMNVTVGAGWGTGVAGGSQPFSVLPPYLCLNFCIALEGIYPARN